jgi:hypothetical protein
MEKSDLEAERVALFESVMNNQRRMKQLEANLLERLTSTQVGSLQHSRNSNWNSVRRVRWWTTRS